jgi:hypothetical protein
MNTLPDSPGQPITRREALRRTVLFSAGAFTAGRFGLFEAGAAETKFAGGGMHFLALGDYGTKGNDRQVAVAKAMSTFARSLGQPLSAVLALGDNFYRKLTPERFDDHFEKLYSPTDLNCPFYACAGNHDYGTAIYDRQEGKLQMQLDYARNNPESRWKFPAKWYSVELPNAQQPLVKMIVLDGNYWEGALTPKEKVAQRRFLQAQLEKKTTAPWLWVVNHFPIFSDGKVRGDNKSLIRAWGKLIKEHPVSLCFAGHDHMLQHLRVEGYATSFIVSGAGGASFYDVKLTDRGFVDNRNLGFNHIHVTPERLSVQFINAEGQCLHHFERNPAGEVKVLV